MVDDKDKVEGQGTTTPAKPVASPAKQGFASAWEQLMVSAKELIRETVDNTVEDALAAIDKGKKGDK